jgi:hypothetical protein
MDASMSTTKNRDPWNKGRLIGQKLPLKLKEIWAIRIRLQLAERLRDLALFNLAIDSKLRGCDLVSLRAEAYFIVPSSCSGRPNGLSSSKSLSKLVSHYLVGSTTES